MPQTPAENPGGAEPHRGLAGNPAKTKEIFSQDHPYFPANCNACPFYKPGFRAKFRDLFYNRRKNCTGNCQYIDNAMAQAQRHDQYDPKIWKQTHQPKSGNGYVMTELERLAEAEKSKQAKAIYKKETGMCNVAADNGFRVEHLRGENRQPGETYDTRMNEIPTDLKSTRSHNNIVKYARYAYKWQGAESILFELTNRSAKIMEALKDIKRRCPGMKVYYYYSDEKVVQEI